MKEYQLLAECGEYRREFLLPKRNCPMKLPMFGDESSVLFISQSFGTRRSFGLCSGKRGRSRRGGFRSGLPTTCVANLRSSCMGEILFRSGQSQTQKMTNRFQLAFLTIMVVITNSRSSLARSFPVETKSPTSTPSVWKSIAPGPPDAILGIAQAFRECQDPRKVNVCVGAYRDEAGKSWVLPSVRRAEELMLEENEVKDYLPIEGDEAFIQQALRFAYGSDATAAISNIAGVQTLSGTGACRIGGAFLGQFWPGCRQIYIPVPTWGNHWKIFDACGLETKPYRYYNPSTNSLDLQGMLEDIRQAPDGSIILLHACAHNPTGCDPSMEQWEEITDLLESKQHCAFFDSAYQGFASGDAERDAAALRYVVARGTVPVLLAQSFAKNFGLYGERCGTLSVVGSSREERDRLLSQLKCIIRPMYSSPPRHGSSIVKRVLSDQTLADQYNRECAQMADRIQTMRLRLVDALKEAGSQHDWSHVASQIGMFAFTGMSSDMCDRLTSEYAIYLTRDGRISIAGLNESNIQYVAEAIHDVTHGTSITGNA